MFAPKVKIDRELHARLVKTAVDRGYASVEEFIVHVLERAVANDDGPADADAEVEKQLRGLGYIE